MADLSQTDLDWIRDYVGSSPSDDALADHFADLGDKVKVALRVLRRRVADMKANPANLTITGVLTVSTAENIKALAAQIDELEALLDAGDDAEPGDASSGKLFRCDLAR